MCIRDSCITPGCPNGDSDFVQGWGNGEAQYYTSCRDGYSKNCDSAKNTTENAFIEDGFLKIQPIFNDSDPFNDPYCSNGSCSYTWDYTSARIMTSSKKIISPGTEVTVCFRHPEGSGHWPAFWMLPQGFIEGQKTWPNDGENDLVEHMQNHQAYETQSTVHFGSSDNANYIYKIESVPADVDFYDKFHSITMRWETDKIEYFLDCSSPWTYLSFRGVLDLMKRKDFDIIWKPILVGGIFNSINPSVYESRKNPVKEKLEYSQKDLQDWSRSREIEINWPKIFPINSVKAMRGSFYFVDNGGAELYFEAIFRSYWTEGKDISDNDRLASIVSELGVNPKEFLDFINDETVKSRLIKNTQELMDRGGFGSPTFFVDELDMYFGNDRIQLIEEIL